MDRLRIAQLSLSGGLAPADHAPRRMDLLDALGPVGLIGYALDVRQCMGLCRSLARDAYLAHSIADDENGVFWLPDDELHRLSVGGGGLLHSGPLQVIGAYKESPALGRRRLHIAAWQGDVNRVRFWLVAGCNVNQRFALPQRTLPSHVQEHEWIGRKEEHAAQADAPPWADVKGGTRGASALCMALHCGHEDVVQLLVSHPSLNPTGALRDAVEYGRADLVGQLVRAGADAVPEFTRMAHAAREAFRNVEEASYPFGFVLKEGGPILEGVQLSIFQELCAHPGVDATDALDVAIRLNLPDVVEPLCARGADVASDSVCEAAFAAAGAGLTRVCTALAPRVPADTALHLAVRFDLPDVLHTHAAAVDSSNRCWELLNKAVQDKAVGCVGALLALPWFDPNMSSYQSLLQVNTVVGDPAIARMLMERGLQPEHAFGAGWYQELATTQERQVHAPIPGAGPQRALLAACVLGYEEQVRALVDQGVSVNALVPVNGPGDKGLDTRTALAAACEGCRPRVVELLLNRGAKVHVSVCANGVKVLPLHLCLATDLQGKRYDAALDTRVKEVVQALCIEGADVNATTPSVFWWLPRWVRPPTAQHPVEVAAQHSLKGAVQVLCRHKRVQRGQALLTAVQVGDSEAVLHVLNERYPFKRIPWFGAVPCDARTLLLGASGLLVWCAAPQELRGDTLGHFLAALFVGCVVAATPVPVAYVPASIQSVIVYILLRSGLGSAALVSWWNRVHALMFVLLLWATVEWYVQPTHDLNKVLQRAVEGGLKDVFVPLVTAGAAPKQIRSPMIFNQLLDAIKAQDMVLMKDLLDFGAPTDGNLLKTAIEYAPELALELFRHGVDLHTPSVPDVDWQPADKDEVYAKLDSWCRLLLQRHPRDGYQTLSFPSRTDVTMQLVDAVCNHKKVPADMALLVAACYGAENTFFALRDRGARVQGVVAVHALNRAIRAESPAIVSALLEMGADVNETMSDQIGYAPFSTARFVGGVTVATDLALQAQQNGHPRAAQRLAVARHILLHDGLDKQKALYFAATLGMQECVLSLLRRGADPNLPSPYGRLPLHAACAQGHEACVALLIQHGADVNAVACKSKNVRIDIHVRTMGGMAVRPLECAGLLHPAMLTLLLLNGATVMEYQVRDIALLLKDKPWHSALGGARQVVYTTLRVLATHASTLPSLSLHLAAAAGMTGLVCDILSTAAAGGWYSDKAVQESTIEVVAVSSPSTVRVLCAHPQTDPTIALPAAAEAGLTDVVRDLLRRGADVNAAADAADRWVSPTSAVNRACLCKRATGSLAVLQLLLASPGVDLQDALFDACKWGKEPHIRLVLQAGANPNVASDRTGRTALEVFPQWRELLSEALE